jgi:hypothetical protein
MRLGTIFFALAIVAARQRSTDIGRPPLNEAYDVRAVTGSTGISAFLPVVWFIEPPAARFNFATSAAPGYAADEFALRIHNVFS